MITYSDQEQKGNGVFDLYFRSQLIIEVCQGRNSRQSLEEGLEAETDALSGLFFGSYLGRFHDTVQPHLPKDDTVHSGLSTPTPIIN